MCEIARIGAKVKKQEFIDNLQKALVGNISPGAVSENIYYYENYINVQMQSGSTEEEIMESLGDPRLIAKTIIETQQVEETHTSEFVEPEIGRGRTFELSSFKVWMGILLVLVIVILIIGAFFSILSMLMPILIPLLIVLFLYRMFQRR